MMAEADFVEVLGELEALESELDAIRVAVDEGEETFSSAPTARQAAMRHLELAMHHTVDAACALIEETDWEQPEDNLEAIEILAEEEVIPGRLGSTLMSLVEYSAERSEDGGWETDQEEDGSFDNLSEGAEALAEYLEYMHHFLKEWEA